jgi:hypothetical protein
MGTTIAELKLMCVEEDTVCSAPWLPQSILLSFFFCLICNSDLRVCVWVGVALDPNGRNDLWWIGVCTHSTLQHDIIFAKLTIQKRWPDNFSFPFFEESSDFSVERLILCCVSMALWPVGHEWFGWETNSCPTAADQDNYCPSLLTKLYLQFILWF